MDYIFGSNDQEPPKSKIKHKELRQEITIKQDPLNKPKQLTPLQRFKLEQRKKLVEQEELHNEGNQFDHMDGNDADYPVNGNKTKQPTQFGQNVSGKFGSSNTLMQPVTHSYQKMSDQGINEPEPERQVAPSQQIRGNNSKKREESPLNKKATPKREESGLKGDGKNDDKRPGLKVEVREVLGAGVKEKKGTKDVGPRGKVVIGVKADSKEVNQTNSAKEISPSKQNSKLKEIKPIKSAKQIMSPIKESSKQIANVKPSTNPPVTNLIRLKKPTANPPLSSSISKTLEAPIGNHKNDRSSSKLYPNPKPSLTKSPSKPSPSLTNHQQPTRPSIKQLKQTKLKEMLLKDVDYNFGSDEFVPGEKMNVNQMLEGQLSQSQKGMRFLDKKLIGDWLGDRETLVYNALTSSKPQEYLKGMYSNIEPDNEFIKGEVNDVVSNALQNINNLISSSEQNGERSHPTINIQKRNSPRHKDDLKHLQKLDKYRMIKIKEGEVKHKVGDLRHELEKEYFRNKNGVTIDSSDVISTDYYAMDHPETLKAQSLIRDIHKRRKSEHRHFKELLNQKEMEKEKIQQIEKEYEEMLNHERKEKLREFYEQKHVEREQQKEELKKKEEEFKEWIKVYEREKPLSEKLEEQMVMKFIIPEIEDRHKKLMKIKAEHRPIDIEQINEHEHRYMQYKRDQQIRQKAHIETKLQNDHMNEEQASRHYKGKYRYLILESMYEEKNQTDPKDIERSKKERQLSYSDQVRYVHQSLIKKRSEQPQQEDTRALVRRVRNSDGSVDAKGNGDRLSKTIEVEGTGGATTDRPHVRRDVQTIDVYAEGLKNLQYVKSHVRDKLANGEEKRPKIQLVQQKQHNRDYLTQLRQQRQHASLPHRQKQHPSPSLNNRSSFDQSGLGKNLPSTSSTTNDVESLRARVDNLDERLKRKQFKQRHVKDHHSLMDAKLENDYVESINAKLRLVQELK